MVGASSCEKDSVTSPSYCTLADVGECAQADGQPRAWGKTGWGRHGGQVASVAEEELKVDVPKMANSTENSDFG